ncbi:hypothetical protein ONZ45_g14600 [Pleurotus djamor]|nr:hypothetical protein ONZ45_g14600 [Pleurotus djamor]
MAATSAWSLYVNRSAQVFRDNVAKMLLMQGADAPSRAPRTLFTFNSPLDIAQFATGSDADIGGLSTVSIDPCADQSVNKPLGKRMTAVFHGNMSLGVRPGMEGRLKRSGYAGFRNKTRPTLFGNMTEDVSLHRYLALRTDGPISTDLWQHRLYFQRDGGWEDLYIPFDNFVLTNSGEIAETQITMYRERIRSIGISILGGNSGVQGRYELGVDEIRVVNDEDVDVHRLASSS